MTQTERVIHVLRLRGEAGLSPLEALDEIGSLRLGARIYDARERIDPSEEIVTTFETRGGKTYARYVLRRRTSVVRQEAFGW